PIYSKNQNHLNEYYKALKTMQLNTFFKIFALLFLSAACRDNRPQPNVKSVFADAETPAVQARTGDDAADDPAIWVNPADSTKSTIIGTVKRYGLEVYDLQGRLLHSYKTGNPNNVDLRYGFPLANGDTVDIAACSDRSTNEILIFKINPSDAGLTLISGGRIKSKLAEVYGICFYKNLITNQFYIFLNGKDGTVEQYLLEAFGENEVNAKLIRTLKLETQPEGMVADDRFQIVYFGEEDKGIWKTNAEPGNPTIPALLPNSGTENPNIAYDIEGLCIFQSSDSTGYLIASSQGNNSYAVFERQGANRYMGSFSINDGEIDGTYDTDGIDVTAANLGAAFPKGLFVAQDGDNRDENGKAVPQNFKLVSWEKIAESF
ncbi:MAG: phytase, partial [Saprospiraceae bacterium]